MSGIEIYPNYVFAHPGRRTHICIMLLDLHVHSDLSACSRMSLDQIGRTAAGLSIDGLCLTDHQVMSGNRAIEAMDTPALVLVGIEYATSQGDFLLFGLDKPPIDGMDAPDILALVQHLGAAAIAAHPCRAGRPVDPSILGTGLVNAVEVLNGRCTPAENIAAMELARAFGLPQTGGSDAHTTPELGRFVTAFDDPIADEKQLALAIRRGDVSPVDTLENQIALPNLLAARA